MLSQATFMQVEQERSKSDHAVAVRAKRKQTEKDTRSVNSVLYALGHNAYHASVPLNTVNDALVANGFDALDEMLLCGSRGMLHESVGRNRWLTLTWYKMESGNYEVVAYVS